MRVRIARDLLTGFIVGWLIVAFSWPSPARAHNSTYWFNPLSWDNISDFWDGDGSGLAEDDDGFH